MQSFKRRLSGSGKGLIATLSLMVLVSSGAWVLSGEVALTKAPAARIEAALPSDCLLHVAYDGVSGAKNCRRLALAELWNEPQMKNFLKPLMEMAEGMISEQSKELEKNTGMTVADLEAFAQARVTATLVDVALSADGQSPPAVDFVLTLDVGANKDLIARLQGFVSKMIEAQMGAAPQQVDLAGQTAFSVDIEGVTVLWAGINGTLVAGTNVDTMSGVLTRLKAGAATGGLIESAGYSIARKKCAPSNEAVVFSYLNLEKAVKLAENSPLAEQPDFGTMMAMLEVFGLSSLKDVAYAMNFEGRAIVDRMWVGAPNGLTGLYRHFPQGKSPLRTAAMAPRESFFYEGGRIDLAGIVNEALAAVENFDAEVSKEIQEAKAELEEKLGFSLTGDLLPSMGNEFGFWVGRAPYGGMIPEIMVAWELADAARFQGCLDKAVGAAGEGSPIHSFEFMGNKIGWFDVGAVVPKNGPIGFGLKPCWMVDGNMLMFALAPQTLKNYSASRGAQRPGIDSHADVVEALTHLRQSNPSAGLTSLAFIDLGSAVSMAIDTVVPIAQSMSMPDEVPLDMTQFPTTDVFRKHIFGITLVSTLGDGGGLTEIYSPTGYMSSIVALSAGVAGFTIAESRSAPVEWEPVEPEPGEDK